MAESCLQAICRPGARFSGSASSRKLGDGQTRHWPSARENREDAGEWLGKRNLRQTSIFGCSEEVPQIKFPQAVTRWQNWAPSLLELAIEIISVLSNDKAHNLAHHANAFRRGDRPVTLVQASADTSSSSLISYPMATRRCDSLVSSLSSQTTKTDPATAVENLVPYSLSQPAIFKTNQLLPIKDLKLLVRDYKVSSTLEPFHDTD